MLSLLKRADEYYACIADLIGTPEGLSMDAIPQHVAEVSCLFHCIFVSYLSFRVCRFLGLDYEAAARGGLLHDLFLYDWRVDGSHASPHAFTHPRAALENAARLCRLSPIERDVIEKHMWPLTLRSWPRYRETLIVSTADKICAVAELFRIYRLLRLGTRFSAAVRLLPRPVSGKI